MNYVPLYIKTDYSLLSSIIKIDDLIQKAKEYHYTALTITDNNMYGVMDFYKKCIKNNIKPIIGLEVKDIILYAKNYDGYKNLIKINTNVKNIEIKDLEKYSSNLICIIPFRKRELYSTINKIYENTFIGYSNIEEYNNLDKNVAIYLKETLYLNKGEGKYLDYLIALKDGKTTDEIENNKTNNYLLNKEQIKNIDKTIYNNQKIFELCNTQIKFHNDLLPVYNCPNNLDSFSYLKQLCIEGLKSAFGNKVNKTYQERLKYELNIINNMGFCNYFLVVWDYVKYAKENNILVGPGRGSAAGSLVAYLLNITTIDPLKYNLLFERFLNPERISMPDIDMDFEDERREEVINYCINKYGKKKVAGIITFGTLGAKQAIRDIGRVMDIKLSIVDDICKQIDSKLTLKENYKDKLKFIIDNDSQLKQLYKIAIKFEGLKRHTSMHAAGIVICNKDIDEVIPLVEKDDMYVTSYSMEYLEEIGLLKMDFLGLKNLTLIKDVLEEINDDAITFDTIPLDDKKAFEVFYNVNTLGIFQFESQGMMNLLKKFKPTNFEDIFALIALFRPGPMKNIDSYIKRKNGLEKIDYFDKSLENILKPTYGILVYQEQIMKVANIMASYSLGEADVLRRAMSKKKADVLLKEKDKFIRGSIKNGYIEELANKVYNLILKFASYGFNRAHSVAYATISYKMAYLKAHYKTEFMKSLLTSELGSSNKTKDYIYECKNNEIEILKPDINKSELYYKIEDGKIRYPLTGLKNIGSSIVKYIINVRNEGKFLDIFDFIKRTDRKNVNKSTIISLIDAGCFDSFNLNHRTMIESIDLIINYGELIHDLDEEFVSKPELEIKQEYFKKELLKRELEVVGFYISDNLITEYKIKYNNNLAIKDISNYFDKKVIIIGNVNYIKEIKSKEDKKMCFFKLTDELSSIDCVVFPKFYEEYNDFIDDDIVIVKGRVEKRFDKYQIVVNEIKKVDDLT